MEGRLKVQARPTTPEQAQGPFYPVTKPADQDNDLTAIKGKPEKAQGQIIQIIGRVLNAKGAPVAGAQVEIWQANTFGRYTHPQDSNPAPLDPGFQGYGTQKTDAAGRYRFRTVKPGSYAVNDAWRRPPHVHFSITGPSSRLVTQMYFDGEPLNDTDPILNNVEGRQRLIVKLVPPSGDAGKDAQVAPFDIVVAED
jgi:protocatechuate 3,4-dioxygenase beta subunit